MQTSLFTLGNLYFSLYAHGCVTSAWASSWFCFFSSSLVECLQSMQQGQASSRLLDVIKRSHPFAVVAIPLLTSGLQGRASLEMFRALFFGWVANNISLNHLVQNCIGKENPFGVSFLIRVALGTEIFHVLLWDFVVSASTPGGNWTKEMCENT